MVCLGNICRSPLAEGILKQKVAERQLNWEVDSAGTGAWHVGELPDPRSISTARKHSLDITDQRARQFQAKDLKEYDLILAMDVSNYRNILQLDQENLYKNKVKMIMNYLHPQGNISVPDPYWDDNGFEQVYEMLDKACEQLIATHHNA
ncbi:MAG: low molecular weight protein-tyrosine-phosphatase [Bacteroidota bacterium]